MAAPKFIEIDGKRFDVYSAYPPARLILPRGLSSRARRARLSRNGIEAEGPHWPRDRESRLAAPV